MPDDPDDPDVLLRRVLATAPQAGARVTCASRPAGPEPDPHWLQVRTHSGFVEVHCYGALDAVQCPGPAQPAGYIGLPAQRSVNSVRKISNYGGT